ncbi:uncharacterized protein HaLaN_14996 [Haematococcus lacustris]|uniref:Uncharacterized protein n=1 Tax=Haematococcus lacustris TaxID=44745 RepID=A0A699Z9X9_HAELA|nr:uncharacterized protein HaLaN_14996 [Haematococcus lacustris]
MPVLSEAVCCYMSQRCTMGCETVIMMMQAGAGDHEPSRACAGPAEWLSSSSLQGPGRVPLPLQLGLSSWQLWRVAWADPLRAIQFGSEIGKLSNVREFGSNRAANKQSAGYVSISQLGGIPLPNDVKAAM